VEKSAESKGKRVRSGVGFGFDLVWFGLVWFVGFLGRWDGMGWDGEWAGWKWPNLAKRNLSSHHRDRRR